MVKKHIASQSTQKSNYAKFSILIEFVSALVFGVHVAFVLLDIGVFKVNGVLGVAFLAGLFGPDLMNVLARKVRGSIFFLMFFQLEVLVYFLHNAKL